MTTPSVFEYKKPLSFPRIVGCYDTGSENYEKVRHRVAFRSAIRFIDNPDVIIKYPREDHQVSIGIVRYEDFMIWNGCDGILEPNTFGIIIIDDRIISELGGTPMWKFGANHIPAKTLQDAIQHIPMTYTESSENKGVVWARRMAYLVGITHFISAYPNISASDDIVSQGITELNENNPDDMNNGIPEIVWASNILKVKNYDDRRLILQNTTKMIHTPIKKRSVDKMILFGSAEFVNAERFRYTDDRDKCVPVTFCPTKDEKVGLTTIGEMLAYVYENTVEGSVLYIMRQEATEMAFSILRSAIRMSPKTIASLFPFVMPDVPDPKPELYHRGDSRVTAGYLIRRDNVKGEAIVSDRLSQCTLYSNNHSSVVPSEFLKKHYMIGNGTRQIAVGFPAIASFVLINGIPPTPSDVVCPEVMPIGLPSSDAIRNIPNIVSKCEYQPPIIVNPLKALSDNQPLEIRTYLNMTNKSLRRDGKSDVELKDSPSSISSKCPIQFIDGNNYRIRRNHWSSSGVAQTYWSEGSNNRETGFIHKSIVLEDSVYIPFLNLTDDIQSKECVLSIVNQFAVSKYIADNSIRDRISMEGLSTLIPVYNRYLESILVMEKKPVAVQIIDSSLANVFGGRGSLITSYPSDMKNYGFVPHLVRMANQSIVKRIKEEALTPLTPPASSVGLIIGDKWGDLIQSIVTKHHPTIEWKCVKTLADGTPQDFTRAKYIIGSQTSNAWAGLIFSDPSICRVIEIEYEHAASLSMYHLGMALGVCEYQIFPLKHEPTSRCEKRIRDNLLKYIHE